MRYGVIFGAALVAVMGATASAEPTREQCLELLNQAEADKIALTAYVNEMAARFDRVASLDSENPKEMELQAATFDFADQIDAHLARYSAAVGDLCRDKL